MRERLDALGVDYEITDAVDGAALDLRQYENRLRADKWKFLRGRELSRGEIGCYLSHYNLWQRIAAGGECALILEDDVIPGDGFAEVVLRLPKVRWHWDVVLLSARKRYALDRALCELGKGRRLVRYRKRVGTTRAYMITPQGARKLLDYCYEIRAPVDWLYAEWWKNDVAFYGVDPAVASHAQTESVIGKPKRLRRGFREWSHAQVLRHIDWWRRNWYRHKYPPRKKH